MGKVTIRRKVIPENPAKVGSRHGRLLVIDDGWEQVSESGYRSDMVKVRCDCGVEKFIRPRSLWQKGTKSCGCLQRETAAALGRAANLRHGDARSGGLRAPEYGVYRTMLSRCYNPNAKKFGDYGGRGIVVCSRWQGVGGYERFLADMGRRPQGYSIERVDQNGPYSPDNCRWASAKDQANNRRSNRIVDFAGRSMTLAQWAESVGIKPSTLRDRIARGWDFQMALNLPVNQ